MFRANEVFAVAAGLLLAVSAEADVRFDASLDRPDVSQSRQVQQSQIYDAQAARQSGGMNDYITKPLERTKLFEAIAAVAGRS